MLEFRTQGFQGYSTQYSPFIDSRLAVGTSANFGLVGNGRLYILNLTPDGIVAEKWYSLHPFESHQSDECSLTLSLHRYDTQDSIFDVSWSEAHENQILAASGDGTIKLFDTTLDEFPVRSWHEHKREVFSVHWNLVSKDTFCSSSWDGTVKIVRAFTPLSTLSSIYQQTQTSNNSLSLSLSLSTQWSPHRPTSSILTIPTHSCTYSTLWCPSSPDILSCVSSDSHLRIFDLRTPTSAANHLTALIPIHQHKGEQPSEALTHDWNKYRPTIIATAGVDRLIRTFDLRAAPDQGAQTVLSGHSYAVRRIAWSPHRPDILLSGSYDMTCRVWTDGQSNASDDDPAARGVGREIGRMEAHTEFVTGLDWCLFGAEGWCATCSWDERVLVWDVGAFVGR